MKTNKELQRRVMDELQFEPSVDSAAIGVTANEDIVTLTGTVNSYAEKTAAVRASERVSGVGAVVNNMHVELPSLHLRNDEDLARSVLHSFEWSVLIPHNQIKVKVENGWVVLEGKVDYKYQKTAAEEAIYNLTGVRGLSNSIEVIPVPNVGEVKSKIENAFRRASEIDAKNIKVDVFNGEVTLRGQVHSRTERVAAENAAWSAPGVRQVKDEMTIPA